MKLNRFLLASLAAAVAVALSGCDKLTLFKKDTEAEAPAATQEASADGSPAAATGTDATTAAAAAQEPTPAPTPEKEEINRNAGVIILCYHRFVEKNPDSLAITPEVFEQQLQALKDNGISVISMQDFLAWRRGEKSIPDKSALITIDDGFVSAYTMGWPILKKFEYPFTMFVYMDYIGVGGQAITWDQLIDMRDNGVDIQSHTWSHQSLSGKGRLVGKKHRDEIAKNGYEAWLEKEIGGTKNALEERLGIRVSALAYPYGIHTEEARAMVLKTGYEVAFTVYGQRNGIDFPAPEQIGRYAIDSKKPEIFEAAIRAINSGSTAGPSAPSTTTVDTATLSPEPADGSTVTTPLTGIKANIASLGNIDAGTLEVRISGVGAVPATYDAASSTVSYTFDSKDPTLRPGNYTVIVSGRSGGKRVEARWGFEYAPAAQ